MEIDEEERVSILHVCVAWSVIQNGIKSPLWLHVSVNSHRSPQEFRTDTDNHSALFLCEKTEHLCADNP